MLKIEEVKQNLINDDIKLVSYFSTITMMHGPTSIRPTNLFFCSSVSQSFSLEEPLPKEKFIDQKNMTVPLRNKKRTRTKLYITLNTNCTEQYEEEADIVRDYSSTANCRTKIFATLPGIFRNFCGIPKLLFNSGTISREALNNVLLKPGW